MNHPAYTTHIWEELIACVRRLNKNFDEPLTGFDRSIVKRQLYHMMFLEQESDNPFETIAYNDHEHLDEYSGLSGLLAKFANCGLAEKINISFEEFIHLPNWLADWAIEWALKDGINRNADTQESLDKLQQEFEQSQRRDKKNKDPFSPAY